MLILLIFLFPGVLTQTLDFEVHLLEPKWNDSLKFVVDNYYCRLNNEKCYFRYKNINFNLTVTTFEDRIRWMDIDYFYKSLRLVKPNIGQSLDNFVKGKLDIIREDTVYEVVKYFLSNNNFQDILKAFELDYIKVYIAFLTKNNLTQVLKNGTYLEENFSKADPYIRRKLDVNSFDNIFQKFENKTAFGFLFQENVQYYSRQFTKETAYKWLKNITMPVFKLANLTVLTEVIRTAKAIGTIVAPNVIITFKNSIYGDYLKNYIDYYIKNQRYYTIPQNVYSQYTEFLSNNSNARIQELEKVRKKAPNRLNNCFAAEIHNRNVTWKAVSVNTNKDTISLSPGNELNSDLKLGLPLVCDGIISGIFGNNQDYYRTYDRRRCFLFWCW